MEDGLHFVAHVVVSVVFILTAGGVFILRPIAKRLSEALELYARERHSGLPEEIGQVRELLEAMSTRLQVMEERRDFAEQLFGADERSEREVLQGQHAPLGRKRPKRRRRAGALARRARVGEGVNSPEGGASSTSCVFR